MALTTTVENHGQPHQPHQTHQAHQAHRGVASGSARAATVTTAGGGLEALVDRVLDCPDEVSREVMAEAVRGLEALGGVSLGGTATDARVVLQRRFGRALDRSGWAGGGA